MHAYIYIYTHTYIHTYTYINIHTHTHIYTYIYTYTHTHTAQCALHHKHTKYADENNNILGQMFGRVRSIQYPLHLSTHVLRIKLNRATKFNTKEAAKC
jgi:hypothetical protein